MARGTLTKAGAGAVNIGALSAGPFTATSSTYTLVSGTDGHWTLPTDGTTPAPTSTGDSADLNGGPYVFNYTSTDGVNSRSGVLILSTRANTFTVSLRTEVSNSAGTTSPILSAVSGNRVEIAKGATDFANATYAAPLYLTKWRPAGGCTIGNEDDAHPAPVANIQIKLPLNLTLQKLNFRPQARIQNIVGGVDKSVDKGVYVRTTAPSTGTDQQTTNTITFDRCSLTGIADPGKAAYGYYCTDDGAPLTVTFLGNHDIQWTQKPLSLGATSGLGITVNGNVSGNEAWMRIRYWTEDGFIPSANSSETSSWNFHHITFMSPMFDTANATIHPDSVQFPAGTNAKNFNVDMLDLIQADGNSISQTFFSKNSQIGATVKNEISVGRSKHCFTISGTDSAHVVTGRNVTAITQWSGVYSAGDPASNVLDPGLWLINGTGTIDPAYLTLSNFWAQGNINNGSSYAPTTDVVNAGLTSGDISSVFPGAAWISSPTLKAAALAGTNVADTRWTADFDAVYASVIAALIPASGQVGALKSDGTRPLV